MKRYGELYSSYEEFMEEEAMLLKRLETHGKEWIAAREEAARAQQEVERVKLSVHKLKKRVRELEKQLEEARKP